MPDVATSRLLLTKPEVGGSDDTWGDKLNANLDILDDAYTLGNILGTVSQSGGVPTGALIQRGSNANGQYTRFADGTQICWSGLLETSVAGSSYSELTWTHPASFITNPGVSFTWETSGTAANIADAIKAGCGVAVRSNATNAAVVFANNTGSALTMRARVVAVGRWF